MSSLAGTELAYVARQAGAIFFTDLSNAGLGKPALDVQLSEGRDDGKREKMGKRWEKFVTSRASCQIAIKYDARTVLNVVVGESSSCAQCSSNLCKVDLQKTRRDLEPWAT